MHIDENSKMFEIEEIFQLYNRFKQEVQSALKEFQNVPKDDYFYELCYCLLTPASKAQNALIVVEYLKKHSFLDIGFNPTNVLRGNVFASSSPKIYIRFHNQKAKRLLKARDDWQKISEILNSNLDIHKKREQLVQNVYGFGYKEASHFLRNIGYKGIAILDRHILRNLVNFGLLADLPSIASRKNYLAVEAIFFNFSHKIGIPPEELDLLFWAKETGYVLK